MADGMSSKISNILGVPLPPWLRDQIMTRSKYNSLDDRSSNDNAKYLSGKTAWVRLVSSVDMISDEDRTYFSNNYGLILNNSRSLAKQFTLFAGSSVYMDPNFNTLRNGINNLNRPYEQYKASYGVLGKQEIYNFGYRPMPGLQNVNITTQGKLGSVRVATINFKCWDKMQLDIMDTLYFKLGYTMYLEWGQTYFYPSREFAQSVDEDSYVTYAKGKLVSSEIFSIDPFQDGLTKEKINEYTAQSVQLSEGNYDAMLGMCTNFNFTYNQEGGYDCQIKLMSLGVLADSTKINHTSTISGVLDEQVKYYNELLKIKKAEEEARKAEEEKQRQEDLRKELTELFKNSRIDSTRKVRVASDGTDFNEVLRIKYQIDDQKFKEITGISLGGGDGTEPITDKELIPEPKTYNDLVRTNYLLDPSSSAAVKSILSPLGFEDEYEKGLLYQWGSQDQQTEQNKINWIVVKKKTKNSNNTTVNSVQLAVAYPKNKAIITNNNKDIDVKVNISGLLKKLGFTYVNETTVPGFTDNELSEYAFGTSKYFKNEAARTGNTEKFTSQNAIGVWYNSPYGLQAQAINDAQKAAERVVKDAATPNQDFVSALGSTLSTIADNAKNLNNNNSYKKNPLYYTSINQFAASYLSDDDGNRIEDITIGDNEYDIEDVFAEFNGGRGGEGAIEDGYPTTSFNEFAYIVFKLIDDQTNFTMRFVAPAESNRIDASDYEPKMYPLPSGTGYNYENYPNLLDLGNQNDVSAGTYFWDGTKKVLKNSSSDKGFFTLIGTVIRKATYITKKDAVAAGQEITVTVATPIQIRSNDFSIISGVSAKPEQQPTDFTATQQSIADSSNITAGTQEATVEEEEQAPTIDSVKSPLSFLSAIEVSLRSIQVHSLVKVLQGGDSTAVNYLQFYNENTPQGNTPFLKQIFANGIFENVLDGLIAGKWEGATYRGSDEDTKFAIKAQYGFVASLLSGAAKIKDLSPVDYQLLLTSYILPYRVNQALEEGTPIEHPVYIPLGFFLMLLNHNCVLYDTKKQANKATPLSYIDFNPEHNFCLSNAQHLTTDPFTALIPFEGEYSDFKQIIDPIVVDGDNIKAPTVAPPAEGDAGDVPKTPTTTPIWNSKSSNKDERDQVSAALRQAKGKNGSYSFKNEVNGGSGTQTYKGKIMNILLNIDYLMGLIKGSAGKSEENRVTLKPILEQILSDLNKCLGNVNVFRLAYVDAGNVHQIVDDQLLPTSGKESVLNTKGTQQPLPLIGKNSIAKSLDFKSEVSTKLANMIAIGANSKDKQSTLGSSGDNFAGYINENFQDRYIPERSEPSSNSGSLDGKINIAVQFNNAVKSFYNSLSPDPGSVSAATTYYVDRMAKLRGTNEATRASAMIPITLNFKTNGISGLAMGHAFTVPDGLLPYSYGKNSPNSTDRIGFVVTGLDHSIDGNVWDTSVKSQMIFLKDPSVYTTGSSIIARASDTGLGGDFERGNVGDYGGSGVTTSDCGCERCYPGAYPKVLDPKTNTYVKQYYCTKQLEGGKTFNTNNFKEFYPNYVFKKGTSDIDISKIGLKPLTESEIIDDTQKNKFNVGTVTNDTNVRKFVVHHTAGRGTAEQVYSVFYGRGLPVQYVIDREAKIHRFMPDGAKGQHVKQYQAAFGSISNAESIGVEIVAKDNNDVTDEQAKAGVRLVHYLGFKKSQVFGHGTVSAPGQKAPDEGKKTIDLIKLC